MQEIRGEKRNGDKVEAKWNVKEVVDPELPADGKDKVEAKWNVKEAPARSLERYQSIK